MSANGPTELGEYRLLERLGQGGMAMVFRAERSGTAGFRKQVAIKRMLPQYRRDPSLLERFAAEARTNARLDHPNLVQVVDFGIEPEPYLVMEFVEGTTLAGLLTRLVERQSPIEIAAACYIGAEAAQGLDHAHRKKDEQGSPLGIVHRDVSPQNILLSNEGSVKVSDFGLVKAADNVVKTGSGVPIGKMSYMSPEQADHHDVDARADVFSLGIVVWEMLAMRPLMPPSDPQKVSEMLRQCEFLPPSHYNPKVPPKLDAVVMACLVGDVAARTPSAQALSMQLREILHELSPGYGREQLGRLLSWSFPEHDWEIDEPHETAAQPSVEERMSMPMIAAAPAMQEAQRESSPDAAGALTDVELAEAVAMPTVPEVRRRAVIPWIVALGVGALLLLFALVAAGAWLWLAPRAAEAGETEDEEPAGAPLGAVRVESTAPATRVFLGPADLGAAPFEADPAVFEGGPLIAISPGHQPVIIAPEALRARIADGGRLRLSPTPHLSPDRAIWVHHEHTAEVRVPGEGQVVGAAPGLIRVPAPGGRLPPVLELRDPEGRRVHLPTDECNDPSKLCVLGDERFPIPRASPR